MIYRHRTIGVFHVTSQDWDCQALHTCSEGIYSTCSWHIHRYYCDTKDTCLVQCLTTYKETCNHVTWVKHHYRQCKGLRIVVAQLVNLFSRNEVLPREISLLCSSFVIYSLKLSNFPTMLLLQLLYKAKYFG